MNNSRLKNKTFSQEDLFNLSELFKLMKPRVMSLVIFTCAVGLLTAPNIVIIMDVDHEKPSVFVEHRDNWTELLHNTIKEYRTRKMFGH